MQTEENSFQTYSNDTSHARDSRFSLRVPAKQADLIRRAAESQETTLTDFVISTAAAAAQHVLADRRWFALDEVAWNAFEAALDRPAVFKPRLSEAVREDDFFSDAD